jgi:hypothetical protein
LQFVDAELQRAQAQAAVLQTARTAYSKALSDILAKEHPGTDGLVFGSAH